MKTLVESLFDKDLATKNINDFSFFRTKDMQVKSDIFQALYSIMTGPDPEYLKQFISLDGYFKNKEEFEYIMDALRFAFKKQGFVSWFHINDDDFERMGNDMTDKEIDAANEELKKFFAKAYNTESNGYFLIFNKKLPKFLIDSIKCTDHWNPKIANIDTWAIHYWPDYGPGISFYGCPKQLDGFIKNLLYN